LDRVRCDREEAPRAQEKISHETDLLHPRSDRVYRDGVIRGLIEAILLEPDGDRLKITMKGDVAGPRHR